MTEPSSKNDTSSSGRFVKFVKKDPKHLRLLLPLATAVVLGAVAAYIAFKPDAPNTTADHAMPESLRILNLAKDLLRRNQPAEAVGILKNYLAEHPEDQDVRLHLAELYLRLGDPDSCDATLAEILSASPDHAQAIWMQGMTERARGNDPAGKFRQAAETPGASADVLGNYGLYLLREDQIQQGGAYLRRAAEGNTTNGRVYAELGKFAFERNRIDEAHRLLKRATELSPRDVEAWAVLAEVQKNRNEPDQAVASLRKALDVSVGPQRGMVLMELGKARMARRGWSEAAELFAQATDYPAVRSQAACLAAQCYYFTEAYGKAMHYIDQASAAAPNEPSVAEWKRKIENARYGSPQTPEQPAPSLLSVPPEAKEPKDNSEEK
jgi:Tfp pilus assembly protein PilF